MSKKQLEVNPLTALADTLEVAQRNTSKMLGKLRRFEDRLNLIDQKMRPVQNTTEKYWAAKENIALTLVEVGKTYEYFRIAGETKGIISTGLNSQNQTEFFDALGKLTLAKKFFETHREIKSSGSVLINIEQLLKTAVASCAEAMEKLLVSCGRSVELVDGVYNIVNPISADVGKDISAICSILEANNHTAHLKTYQRVRIAQVKAELQAHEADHASEWIALTQDNIPYLKGTHPLNAFYTFAFEMLRGELHLWGITLISSQESLLVFIAICDAAVMELQRVMGPVLLEDFKNNKSSHFILKQTNTFLIRLEMLSIFASKFDELRDICRPDVRHESTASITVRTMRNAMVEACADSISILLTSSLDANDATRTSKSKHIKGFGSHNDLNDKTMATSITASITSIDLTSFENCDLHPLTGNVLHCCKELSGFAAVYKRMADTALDINIYVPPNATSVHDLIFSLMENLFTCLKIKADNYSKSLKKQSSKRELTTSNHAMYELPEKVAEGCLAVVKKDLFLSNNLYSLFICLREKNREMLTQQEGTGGSTGASLTGDANAKRRGGGGAGALLPSAAGFTSSVNQQYLRRLASLTESVEQSLAAAQLSFCNALKSVLGLTLEDMSEFKVALDTDKSGKGRVLKAKFTVFNTGMESFLAQQGEWRVSAAALRERMSALMLETILPGYTDFYNKYSNSKFSKKHMSMYLRFPPQDVERIFKTFFGKT